MHQKGSPPHIQKASRHSLLVYLAALESALNRVQTRKGKGMKYKYTVAAFASIALATSVALPATATDPSTPIYVESSTPGASLRVLATSGDIYGSYVLPGTPDGIGVTAEGKNVAIYLNHEFTDQASTYTRGNGAISAGSTVSKLILNPITGQIVSAEDAIKSVVWYDYSTGTYGSKPVAPADSRTKNSYGDSVHGTALNRFCSSSLADAGTFIYTKTTSKTVNGKTVKTTVKTGYSGAIYFNGEEDDNESRSFALNTSGQLVQLPKLGLASTETFNAAPINSLNTVLIGNEDGAVNTSNLRLYVGTKQNDGAWYEKAGLTNGKLYYARVGAMATDSQFRTDIGKGVKAWVSFNEIDTTVNGDKQAATTSLNTGFSRIEDGAFDPQHPNDYYFVTTSSNKAAKATTLDPSTPAVTARDGGALWRLRFQDVTNPLLGGTVEMLLDGSEPQFINMPDNLTIDDQGNILLQEDPGNNVTRSKVWAYRIKDAKLAQVLQFSAKYFDKASATFMTQDEESSGILDVTAMMRKSKSDKNHYYLLDAQVHSEIAIARPDIADATSIKSAIEGGQVYLMTIADWSKIYG
jgi:hypothetical protein